jgi:hypothetical protein
MAEHKGVPSDTPHCLKKRNATGKRSAGFRLRPR